MSKEIPTRFLDLFERKSFAHIATVMPDGSPQVTPVWVDFDGTHVLVNSAKGRQKDLNIRRDERVAVEIQDPDDPYRYLLVRGVVEEITLEGAEDHIDKLSLRYMGVKYGLKSPNNPRVLYKIKPLHVTNSRGWASTMTNNQPVRNVIKVGSKVQIIEKQNQGTGILTEGIVARLLTKSPNHPHGIKVVLMGGKVGRVQNILSE
jgi:uncharacterized repeat protein (TIGR03833 family)